MQLRHELKYQISLPQYFILKHRLAYLLEEDKFTNNQGYYKVDSLYFDDIVNKALSEKLSGVSNREKYRIRTYGDKQTFNLEKKIKRGEYIGKVKDKLTIEQYQAIINDDSDYLEDFLRESYQHKNATGELIQPVLSELIMKRKTRLLKPIVIVSYDREAYIYRYGNVRITFDKHLKSGLNHIDLNDFIGIKAFDDIIFEVKFDDYLPRMIQDIIQEIGLVRQSYSKYVICRQFNKFNQWEDQ